MKKFDPNDLKPCTHMQNLVSAHVDGNLNGIARWYTNAHIKGCPQCQASIPFLNTLKERLGELDGAETCVLAPERMNAVEDRLTKIDNQEASG